MAQAQRPLSPHLQIYRPQLTSLLSITHRATGACLALCLPAFVWWLYAVAAGPAIYTPTKAFLVSQVGLVPLVAVSFALIYHSFNGLRHLFWDTGRGLDLPTLYRTGYAVLALSVLATAGLWAVVLGYVDLNALLGTKPGSGLGSGLSPTMGTLPGGRP
jgi:succinate dehydrogenase / fumarate reductase cytochrome b subunit